HRRRKLVDGKVTRIDDADAAERQEPYFSIRGLGDARTIAGSERMAPDSVRTVENRGPDLSLWVCYPCVQLLPGNPRQAAGHVQPDGIICVFHRPMDCIAGQSVPARKCCDLPVLDPAQPAVGCDP